MSSDEGANAEAKRLENLWHGEFGVAYTDRNANAGVKRREFWDALLSAYPCRSVLEVGCNLGANLKWIADRLPDGDVCGIDVNEYALSRLKAEVPGVRAFHAQARELPFPDRQFDLVFTMTVLIHQPLDMLPAVMSEVVRCSRKYVLAGEYYAQDLTEIPYRGQRGALFKRDFGALYAKMFPDLKLLKTGFLPKDESWDNVTYWLFERTV